MSRRPPLVSIALPVRDGAETLAAVVESVLAQTCPDLELVISDNASSDATPELCAAYARADPRVVYRRHPTNVGLLNNFVSAADAARGTFLRWIGDDDALEPQFLERVLAAFAQDERRVVVTTQIVYRDRHGVERLDAGHDPAALGSDDPVERFGAMLRLLTSDHAALDPLYGVIRRPVATLPRRNMLREDQVFAARMALAGPWGHVAAPLALRRRDEGTAPAIARLLGVPPWRSRVRVLLQCRELSRWVACAPLDAAQRRRAQAEIVAFYARSKSLSARRGLARLGRATGRDPVPAAPGRPA